MLYIASSFLILTLSVASLCVLCAKLVMVIVEQGKLWGRKRIRKLMPTFVCMSLSVAHIVDLLIYAGEVAPSILVGQPAYGAAVHTVMGWCSLITFYTSILQLFVLSALKTKLIVRRKLKNQSGIVKGSVLMCWIMGILLTVVVHEKICHYTISVDEYYSYHCDKHEMQNSFRLAALNGTFCGALLLLTIFFTTYHFYESRGVTHPSTEPDMSNTSFTSASGTILQNQPVEEASNTPMDMNLLLSQWYTCLGIQVLLCMCRVAFMLLILTLEPSSWLGLTQTIMHIVYCSLSDFLYLKIFGNILNYMYHIELKNAMQSSLRQFRLWTSRRSLHNSFRESCRSFHKNQMQSANSLRMTTSTKRKNPGAASTSNGKRKFPEECFMAQIPDSHSLDGSMDPIGRPGIPIVQVEVYQNKDDTMSLRNYDSDDSEHSLHERASRIMSFSTTASTISSLCNTSFSSNDNVAEFMLRPENLSFHYDNLLHDNSNVVIRRTSSSFLTPQVVGISRDDENRSPESCETTFSPNDENFVNV